MSISETISTKSKQYLNDFQNSEKINWFVDQKDMVMGVLNSAISVSNTFVGLTGRAGIAGFVFDIAEDESVELGSLITDHYIETGSPVQDHIALRPEKVVVRGLVGEYKDIVTNKKSSLEKTVEKLTVLTSYLPPISQAANAVFTGLENVKNSSGNVVGALKDIGNTALGLYEAYRNINIPQNEQQKAFVFFEALRNAGAVFTVQTPFRYYTNMAVENIRCTQNADTQDMSRFEVTLKKIRYVDTKIVSLEKKQSSEVQDGKTQERLDQQKQPKTDNGQVETQTTTVEKLSDALEKTITLPKDWKEKASAFSMWWAIKNGVNFFINSAGREIQKNGGGSW